MTFKKNQTNSSQEKAGIATLRSNQISEQKYYYGWGRSLHNNKGVNSSRRYSNVKCLCTLSPLISSNIVGTYQLGEFIFHCHIFLPFLAVHGVLKARIVKWFAIPISSGPHSVRSLHHDLSVLGGPIWHGLVLLSQTRCMQVRKQQLELDMEQQTSSKQEKEYVKAVYCHPAYLTYIQSTS